MFLARTSELGVLQTRQEPFWAALDARRHKRRSSQATVSLTTSSTGLRTSFSTRRDSSSPAPPACAAKFSPLQESVAAAAAPVSAADVEVDVDDDEALCDVIIAEHAALAAAHSLLPALHVMNELCECSAESGKSLLEINKSVQGTLVKIYARGKLSLFHDELVVPVSVAIFRL